VLFATNEDGLLLINEEAKGKITKDEFRYIKLAPGIYSYTVKTTSGSEVISENFTVRAEATNEVFIDVLYFLDLQKEQKSAVQNAHPGASPTTPVLDNKLAPIGTVQGMTAINKDAQLSTINFLLANVILMKGGRFVMGNNKSPLADETEHTVELRPFYFSKFEVTQHQWQLIMGNNPSINQGCPTCPVENVSWEETMSFIQKLNALSNQRFRLPTEAEWEYVSRIGGKDEIEKAGGPEEYVRKTAWYFGNSEKKTQPVGRKQANVSGIFDLMGNVSEWCQDWYDAGYYHHPSGQLNPKGPPAGKEKVVRGGNYREYVGDHFRPSLRNKRKPGEKSGEIGLRLVLDVN
jgi:formylglycine-generating enzyme required for sulfatase activity